MDSLMKKPTRGDIKVALKTLPRGEKGLDATYKQAMERIEGQEAGFQKLAKQVLSWVVHAERPLSSPELLHALAVKAGVPQLDEDFLPELENLVSICAGLVTMNEKSDVIRLVHYTTQEYFERTWITWFPDATRDIATTCITYLSFDAFESGFCPTDGEFEARLQLSLFYDYASRYWGYHVRVASTEHEQSILDFLESEVKVSASSQAMMASKGYSGYSQRVPKQVTGVHIAAYFGLSEAMINLLENGYHADLKDSHGQTPLLWATKYGYEAVVRLLLEQKDVKRDSRDSNGRTALSWAAENGHEAVVQLLLEQKVDIEGKDNNGWTPLHRAAWDMHEAVVQLLLEHKADITSKDNDGWTALHRAAESAHEGVVRLLLEKGANVVVKDELGCMAPHLATEIRYEALVRLLLEEGVVGALHLAIERGHEMVVRVLIEKGANIEMKGNGGATALHQAARRGNEAMMRLLLEKGGNEEAKNDHGETALHCAARFNSAVMLPLLKNGATVKAKNVDGKTPLHLAVTDGNEVAVRLLTGLQDIQINEKDNAGQTPLSLAAANGEEVIVRLLLEQNDVDLESKDEVGRTALLCAADGWVLHQFWRDFDDGRRAAVIQMLMKRDDVKLNTKDKAGRTALLCAAERGRRR
jgi:ankyrin repeat protein